MSEQAQAGYSVTAFSHGTLALKDPLKSQKFYKEFLGLHSVRRATGTQYLWLGGEWIIAALNMAAQAARVTQGVENRFGLRVQTRGEVDAAHAAAVSQQATWEIRQVLPVEDRDDKHSFCLQDLDGNWWEILHRPEPNYDAIFSRAAAS